ncbi:uncharacterized protein B0T15DRAFT_21119 [Chaetomium strumarium]|uniref:Uncharacterized protein n=1 Tax=Chaetomium strumarium TaxID=1170767 RepID=A0AAJ0M5M8_9PEZI|nr:hypothetical protein B0T15DRAFT_21119 [Chaetomium strumarium]
MPSIAQESPTVHGSKKRTRKVIPIPPGKRRRRSVDIDVGGEGGDPMQQSPSGSPPQERQHQQPHQLQRRQQPRSKNTSLEDDAEEEETTSPANLMSRCHICFRRPDLKTYKNSFADCESCGQRTCYVCIRECLGPGSNIDTMQAAEPVPPNTITTTTAAAATTTTSSVEGDTSFTMTDADAEANNEQVWTRESAAGSRHRRMVCSRCCVERGQDGEVVCLGCLQYLEG